MNNKPVNFSSLASGGIANLQPYQPGKPIEELERELGIDNIIKLASNENPRGPSQSVQQVLQQGIADINRYPDGFDLTQKLASRLGVDAKTITLGNGSNQLLNMLAQTFLTAEHNAVISEHAFIVYPLVVKMLGASLKTVPAKNYGHNLSAMASAIDDDTRLVFIANPNNPTGTWNSYEDVCSFMQAVREDVIVVMDEAYAEYANSSDYVSALSLLDKHPNLVVTRTFSKAYGLAGLRAGYAISNEEIADLLNRVREPFNVNSLALLAASAALDDVEYLQQTVALNAQGMQQLEAGLAQLGLDFIPSLANFVTVQFEQDVNALYQKLLTEGVIVRPVGIYNMPQHLRISVGLPEENERLLSALSATLKN